MSHRVHCGLPNGRGCTSSTEPEHRAQCPTQQALSNDHVCFTISSLLPVYSASLVPGTVPGVLRPPHEVSTIIKPILEILKDPERGRNGGE